MTKNPIYCAIDTSCIDDADRIINEISPYIGGIKLGLEFFTSCGVEGIEKISKYNLSEDRADVIDYAMSIYEFVLNRINVEKIKSTKWGVSDSIAVKLYHEIYSNQFQIKN